MTYQGEQLVRVRSTSELHLGLMVFVKRSVTYTGWLTLTGGPRRCAIHPDDPACTVWDCIGPQPLVCGLDRAIERRALFRLRDLPAAKEQTRERERERAE